MLNEEIELVNIEEELLVAIYKALEIYDTIKDTRLIIDNERITDLNKKYLSLLLGINFTKNSVSSVLKLLRYDYGIQVFTYYKREKEYIMIYKKYFKEIFEEGLLNQINSIEETMLKLIETDFIKKLHYNRGLSLISLKTLLENSRIMKEKDKTLQNKQNVLV